MAHYLQRAHKCLGAVRGESVSLNMRIMETTSINTTMVLNKYFVLWVKNNNK